MNVAIITGTSRGLGRALAEQFQLVGWRVVSLNRPDFDLECVDHIALIARLSNLQGDGRAVLVNSAGTLHLGAPREVSEADIRREIATNITGQLLLISAFLRALPAGEVANVSSSAATRPMPGWGLYSAAKAAIDAYVRSLALEGVRCFDLNPGAIDTDMQRAIATSAYPLPSNTKHRRPDIVAKALVWKVTRGV